MKSFEFFDIFFSNLVFFASIMMVTTTFLYLSIRRVSIAGYLDPIHFYWTFTFGTAYGIVISLYFLGHISFFLFFMIISYAFLFLISYHFFCKVKIGVLDSVFPLLLPKGDGKVEFKVIMIAYVILLSIIIFFVGFGLFAEANRFEQNRGFGAFIRIADSLRLFVIAYCSLILFRFHKAGETRKAVKLLFPFVILIVLGAMVNGSKFSLLEAGYASFFAYCVFYKTKPEFKIKRVMLIFFSALIFALISLSINLENNKFEGASPQYLSGGSVLAERLFLRVLGNADKYYLSLPNDVIEKIETDNVIVRFIAPLVGTTKLSSILGYNVNNYNVGRQILLYFNPGRDVAGGPTSHFDLFAYKYFTLWFGWIWVVFTAFLLASIRTLSMNGEGDIFYSSLVSVLWIRSLPILLEPPVGLAYILDVLVFFLFFKLVAFTLPRKGH